MKISGKSNTKQWRITIRNKLLVTSLAILIIPALLVGSMSIWVSARESDLQMENNLRNTVHMTAELIVSFEDAVKKGALRKEEAQEKMKQLLLGPKHPDGTRTINSNIDIGEHGYFFVLNDQGDLVAHPTQEGEKFWDKQTSDGFYHIRDMLQKGQLPGGGVTVYRWPLPDSKVEAMKIAYSLRDPNWGWTIVAGSYIKDYNAGQQRIVQGTVYTLLGCIIAGGIIVILFSLRLTRPIVRLTLLAKQVAAGDLSQRAIAIHNRDEIGDLYASFQTMHSRLRDLTEGLLSHANALSSASRDLSVTFGETTVAADQISVSAQEVALSNESQKRSLQESTNAMEELSASAQRIASTSSIALEASQVTLSHAEQGNELITQSTDQMLAVSTTVGALALIVNQLNERSHQIGEIIDAMSSISSQTNLLALNAAIEAARAGEEGKGFAVVADEIRNLAERSKKSALVVTELIQAILTDINKASAAMDQGEQEVQSGVDSIRHSGEAFRRILVATRSAVYHVQETSAAAEQISARSQEFNASLQEIDHMAVRSDYLAQTISTATAGQLLAMEEISALADSMNRISEEMLLLVKHFKL
ncbi:methyl-accepting chemotaxis protein [Brevibacillus nitrificans]|uniref:methyl-accepting chemotaxis protein n=1 Tax=Brevibacillus nitrificans TaxID=651560 RepID=UPI002E230447|nr:methyl-accepting chemotaxis protein [Brevibacillus nitrificans]